MSPIDSAAFEMTPGLNYCKFHCHICLLCIQNAYKTVTLVILFGLSLCKISVCNKDDRQEVAWFRFHRSKAEDKQNGECNHFITSYVSCCTFWASCSFLLFRLYVGAVIMTWPLCEQYDTMLYLSPGSGLPNIWFHCHQIFCEIWNRLWKHVLQ